MSKLIYTAITSLDGFIEDRDGSFDWSEPDEAIHRFINELERTVGTQLLGRRMYETMQVWETESGFIGTSPILRDYAEIWLAAEKIVFSSTLTTPITQRTRIERSFDPETVRKLKAEANHDLGIGGPNLAAHAFRAGLVDEVRLFLSPITVGSGKPAFPDDLQIHLGLLEDHHFDNGTVYLRYSVDLAGL